MPIQVRTPARLHLGQLDLNGSLGRKFGGIGVAIQQPNVRLEIYPDRDLIVDGEPAMQVRDLAGRFYSHFNLTPGVRIRILSTIPAHVGLGSGTQLRLAVAGGLARFHGLKVTVPELARIMNRGESRSAIGTTAYAAGGFIVDGGLKPEDIPDIDRGTPAPPVLCRHDFPSNWHAVIAIPSRQTGLNEETETRLFRKLTPMLEDDCGKICRLVLIKLLPSLLERDAQSFGSSLTEIQRIIGRYFSPVQGGCFASPLSQKLAERCLEEGAFAASQSSWGPSIYAFVEGKDAAVGMAHELESMLEQHGGGSVLVAAPDNHGARVRGII